MKRGTTKGICSAALEKMGPDRREHYFYSMLRRVNGRRQNEIADLMVACSDCSFSFLNVLIFASNATDFVRAKRRMRGLNKAELEMIEKVMPPLEDAFWRAAKSYADDARSLMVTEAYVRRILGNPQVADFVRSDHPKVFRKLNRMGVVCPQAERTSPDAVENEPQRSCSDEARVHLR